MGKITVRIEKIEVKLNGDQIVSVATTHDDFHGHQIFFTFEKDSSTTINDLQTQVISLIQTYWALSTNNKI